MKYPKEWLGVVDMVGCGEWCTEHRPGVVIELHEIVPAVGWGGGGYVGGRRIADGDEPHRFSFCSLSELKPLTPAARDMLAIAKASAK